MSPDKDKLVIVSGPTAVGKTEISIKLAKKINGEIISADSMQVYRGMDIGSAKVSQGEMDGVPHHLIDILDPKEDFNAALFKSYALRAMKGIYERGRIPIIVGGTGFYIQGLLYDVDFSEQAVDLEARARFTELLETKGAEYLYGILKEKDPEYAEITPMQNSKRVIRALEFFSSTGRKISDHNRREREKESAYESYYFVLTLPRKVLYSRIEERVDKMISDGLLSEVEKLRNSGCTKDMTSMQGLGYKQLFAYLDGRIGYEEAVDAIKKETRHFAKRQMTWFRREKDVIFIDKSRYESDEEIISEIIERFEGKI